MAEEKGRTPIDERVRELEEEGLSKPDIVLTLYEEGYNTHEIMKRGFSLRYLERRLERRKKDDESNVMGAIEGRVKGEGFLAELKEMIRAEISRTRELTELFYDVGLGTLLASLRKSGMGIEDFRKIALERGALREALVKAGETAFKALEYYQSDLIIKVEEERDEARAAYSLVAAQLKELTENLDPKVRLEKMVYAYLLSGSVDASVLITLIDKWLGMELAEIRKVIA